ncbi:MAG: family 16 glycosylhydrolase [Saprospiraceae bacterium]
MFFFKISQILLILIGVLVFLSCTDENPEIKTVPEVGLQIFPYTDSTNTGNWKLLETVSDEFESTPLNESKWLIQGTNGVFQSNFIGRAPSQFSTKNVRIENGKLKLETKWDTEFTYSTKIDNGLKYENITTAAVISKQQFLYGYMEIKCKAADASVTSAFWTTGNKSELDIMENFGKPAQRNKIHLETEMWSSIHDWSKAGGPSVWTKRTQLPFRVATGYHVYGCDWSKDYVKFYADGKLIHEAFAADLGENWVMNNPLWVWVDSETFPWHGIPIKEDLPVDYEIEYIRVWQKK